MCASTERKDWSPWPATPRTPGASVASRALALLGAFDERAPRADADRAGRPGRPAAADRAPAGRRAGRLGRPGPGAAGEYVVGRRLWDLGLLAPVQTGLRQVASPFLHDIYARDPGHRAPRGARRHRGALPRPARRARLGAGGQPVGSRLPLHATGVGKVLLAHAPAEVQAAVLADLPRITPYTVTQPGLLRRQLRPGPCATATRRRSRR